MSFDWKNYFKFAEKLKDISSTKDGQYADAIKRTVISRAYYAGFHIATDYALSNGFQKPTNGHHDKIQTWYRIQFGNVNHQEVSTILARTHKARKEADYDCIEKPNMDAKMESVLDDIQRIEGLL